MTSKFIFVLGAKRSGTTFFRLLLNASFDIEIPKESHFLMPFFKDPERFSTIEEHNRQEILSHVLNSGRFSTWDTTEDRIKDIISRIENGSPLSIFIERIYREEVGKNVLFVGDKTPEYSLYVPEIRRLFPNSPILFLLRDPRDVSDSLANRGWEGWTAYHRGRYLRRVLRAAIRTRDDSQTLIVRYEDIILDKDNTLKNIENFLGTGYDRGGVQDYGALESSITSREKASGVHKSLFRSPDVNDAWKWRNKPNEKYYFLEAHCAREMQSTGYEPLLKQTGAMKFVMLRFLKLKILQIGVVFYHIYHCFVPRVIKETMRQNPLYSHVKKWLRATET
ncbi:sulfotransferase [Paracoccaceae bacterium]|nr:sulfotransferase [Paracoccaceae bacterium]